MDLPVEVVHLDAVHAVETDKEGLRVHLYVLVVVGEDSPEKLRLGGLRHKIAFSGTRGIFSTYGCRTSETKDLELRKRGGHSARK